MKNLISLILIFFSLQLFSQNILDLDSCIEITIKNYPMFREKALNKKITKLNIKNNKSNFLPSLNFEGKATYQSEAFSLDIEMPEIPGFEFNFPEPPLDQYNFSLNLTQLIYDGGTVKNLNIIEQKKLMAEQKKTDVELFQLREQVEKTFFSVLIFQKTEEQILLTLDELNQKKKTVRSAVTNGILTQENFDILQAEIYKLEQNLIEIEEHKKAGLKILQELMSAEYSEEVILKLPENFEIQPDSIMNQRPEEELFAIQNDIFKANKKLLKSNRLPKLAAFGQAGYGNPGLTMINDEWNPYFIVGAKLSWNIWDKNKTKRNTEILEINSDITDIKKESFNKSINILCEREIAEISKLEKMIEKDKDIISLQENICRVSGSKLNNGIITSTDYVTLLNDKNRSLINGEINKIRLIQSKRNYLRIKGN